MGDVLLVDDDWIERLLQGQVNGILKGHSTAKRGSIYLAKKGSGTVVGTAWLINARPATQVELHLALCSRARDLLQPCWWVLEKVRPVVA